MTLKGEALLSGGRMVICKILRGTKGSQPQLLTLTTQAVTNEQILYVCNHSFKVYFLSTY